jgi:excisionase family DNA binding protein
VIVVDTGVLYAAADTDDQHHEACVALAEERAGQLVVPLPVVVEVCYLVQTRLGAPAEARFFPELVDIETVARLLGVGERHVRRMVAEDQIEIVKIGPLRALRS